MDEGNSIASEAGRFIASDAGKGAHLPPLWGRAGVRQSLPDRSRLREERRVALVALGANLGDRAKTLVTALSRLGASRRVLAISPFYETVPVDVPTEQPNFINAVAALAVGDDETPESLLQALLQTEREFGRVRSYKNAPRTCDLDLIFFENETRNSATLTLPHPRWKERAFVLVPLNDLLKSEADWCSREPWRSLAKETADLLAARPPTSCPLRGSSSSSRSDEEQKHHSALAEGGKVCGNDVSGGASVTGDER